MDYYIRKDIRRDFCVLHHLFNKEEIPGFSGSATDDFMLAQTKALAASPEVSAAIIYFIGGFYTPENTAHER